MSLRPSDASTVQLPVGPWSTVFECLCARFPHVPAGTWAERMERGRVLDAAGIPIGREAPFRVGLEVRYWREVADETPVAGVERILHVDDDLVVAYKPHFLPVTPTGSWVEHTLLRRLQRRLGIAALAPLHRLDRLTAGLVLFSVNPRSRPAYHDLFRRHAIQKTYHALAPPLPQRSFPYRHRSCLARGEPFFRMQETEGAPNSETVIDVVERSDGLWHYQLRPRTGRKHQLRVHMAAIGAAIDGDPWYPQLAPRQADDPGRPLALLAHSLQFSDPTTGAERVFVSTQALNGRWE